MSDKRHELERKNSQLPATNRAPITWNELGESFEVMGKIGLAMAVGMSAAGLFCRLADQGKVKVPSLSSLVLNRNDRLSEDGDEKARV